MVFRNSDSTSEVQAHQRHENHERSNPESSVESFHGMNTSLHQVTSANVWEADCNTPGRSLRCSPMRERPPGRRAAKRLRVAAARDWVAATRPCAGNSLGPGPVELTHSNPVGTLNVRAIHKIGGKAIRFRDRLDVGRQRQRGPIAHPRVIHPGGRNRLACRDRHRSCQLLTSIVIILVVPIACRTVIDQVSIEVWAWGGVLLYCSA